MKRKNGAAILSMAVLIGLIVTGVGNRSPEDTALKTSIEENGLASATDVSSSKNSMEGMVDVSGAGIGKVSTIRRTGFSRAIAAVDAPSKPAWELIQQYRTETDAQLEQEVLAAISYCANQQGIQTSMQEIAGDGGEISSEISEVSSKLIDSCQRLNDQDYLLRKEIVEQGVLRGDEDAKIAFFIIGPYGKWPIIDAREQDHSAYESQLRLWSETAIDGLKSLSSYERPEIDAYLSSIHETREGILKYKNDPVRSYAYKYLWAASILANKTASTSVKENVMQELKRAESKLDKPQISRAREVAAQISLERTVK